MSQDFSDELAWVLEQRGSNVKQILDVFELPMVIKKKEEKRLFTYSHYSSIPRGPHARRSTEYSKMTIVCDVLGLH